METTVTWTLKTVPEGTKLHLEHSGISNYAGDTAIDMFESFEGGWNECINKLIDYLRKEENAG